MWIELPNLWIVILNLIGIPVIHFGVSWIFTRLPSSRFHPHSFPFRECACERGGTLYQTLFRIRRWKHFLPDAAPWFDGFAKGSLRDSEPAHLQTFLVETCRGEAAHYAQIPALWLTLIWNPWPVAAIVMIVYAVLSNLPCILLQRFTRARLRQLLAKVAGAVD